MSTECFSRGFSTRPGRRACGSVRFFPTRPQSSGTKQHSRVCGTARSASIFSRRNSTPRKRSAELIQIRSSCSQSRETNSCKRTGSKSRRQQPNRPPLRFFDHAFSCRGYRRAHRNKHAAANVIFGVAPANRVAEKTGDPNREGKQIPGRDQEESLPQPALL